MTRIRSAAVAAIVIFSSCLAADSQDAAKTIPQDPTALMTLAHEKNGLVGADVKPWHMRGTYHAFKDGKPEYEGIYEEWWISPTQYKITFTNPKQTQTDYATGAALLRDGSQKWLEGPEELLRASVVDPLPDPSLLKPFTLVRRERKVGNEKLECVSLTSPVGSNPQVSADYYPAECFGASLPVLRIFKDGSEQIVHDQLIQFQGHFIAKNIHVWNQGKTLADLQLDVVETLKQSPESVINPPSSALPVDLTRIPLNQGKTLFPALLKKAFPVYPDIAKGRRVEGTVTIKATIRADGHVENPEVVDGPMELRAASLDGVKQWIYRPVEVMGKPIPVEIEIHVVFSFGY